MNLFLKSRLYGILTLIALGYWLAEVSSGKVPALKASSGFSTIAITFLLVATLLPYNIIMKIYCITMGSLILIYAVTLSKSGFGRSEKDAVVWIFGMMCAGTVTTFFTLCMDWSNTKKLLESFLIGMASGSLPVLYPMVMERLKRVEAREVGHKEENL